MKNTYTFLGAGNMSEAIASGIFKNDPGAGVTVFVRNRAKEERFSALGCTCTYDLAQALRSGKYIFLSVKPQNFAELLRDVAAVGFPSESVFVSIAAGITTGYVSQMLGGALCIRTMPNTPLLIGCGVTALCRSREVNDTDFGNIVSLFDSLGETLVIDETQMDAVVSVNGSSPAYVYLFIKAMTDAAVASGFSPTDALRTVTATIEGACKMAVSSGKNPGELIAAVTSKGGTTERAMSVLYESDFEGIIRRAMKACDDRASEMSRLFCPEY